jgi:hypothetical protein
VAVATHDALLRAAAAPPRSAASSWHAAHAAGPSDRSRGGAAVSNGSSRSSGRGDSSSMPSWRAAERQPRDAGEEFHTQQGEGIPQHSAVAQAAALRALAAFLAAGPLHRLPPELLPRSIAVRMDMHASRRPALCSGHKQGTASVLQDAHLVHKTDGIGCILW